MRKTVVPHLCWISQKCRPPLSPRPVLFLFVHLFLTLNKSYPMWGLCWICIGSPSFFGHCSLSKHEMWKKIFCGLKWKTTNLLWYHSGWHIDHIIAYKSQRYERKDVINFLCKTSKFVLEFFLWNQLWKSLWKVVNLPELQNVTDPADVSV